MAAARVSATEVAAIGVFGGLSAEALADCARLALCQSLPGRHIIFAQGEACTRFQALITGGIRIAQAGGDGGMALLRFVGPGEPFGSFGMFADGYYPAEATTIVPSLELSWSKAHLHHLIERHPAIALGLVTLAARRLSELQERLREATTLPVDARMAHAVLRLMRAHGVRRAEGRIEIAWPLTRRDVAAISSTSLYTASRVLSRWEREGLITTHKKRLLVNCVDGISQIADSAG